MWRLRRIFYAARSASELASDYKNGWAKIGWASCFINAGGAGEARSAD